MRRVENEVRRRVNSGETVYYAVIPFYEGGARVPSGVDMYVSSESGSTWEYVFNFPR
jgi:hypothetical protein